MKTKTLVSILLAGTAQVVALPALAQTTQTSDASATAPDTKANADITVTGSSIRGVAPVGSPVTNIGRSDIDKVGATNVTELLRAVP